MSFRLRKGGRLYTPHNSTFILEIPLSLGTALDNPSYNWYLIHRLCFRYPNNNLSFKQASQLENIYEGRSQILEGPRKKRFKTLYSSSTEFNIQNEGYPAEKKTFKQQKIEKKNNPSSLN